uniref:SRCR domain-containing protein n=1 Tax=Strigamia maritima TaxID=126957 RepID=T1IIA7_STRMM
MSLCGTLRIIYIVLLPLVIGIDNTTTQSNTTSQVSTNFTENSSNFTSTSTITTSTRATTIQDTDWSVALETSTESTESIEENVEKLPDGCANSLDLEYGKGVFSASDWSPGSVPNDARLNGRAGWIGGFSDVHFVQVDLEQVYRVSGLRLQPHAQWPKNILKEFKVLYSVDGFHWERQPSNTDRRINDVGMWGAGYNEINWFYIGWLVVFDYDELIWIKGARYIVIQPINWVGTPGPALRIELYGCKPPTPTESLLVPVVWRGDITADATWGPGSPYLVHQPVRIWPGITLTLAPGVEILFANPLSGIYVEGTLIANGTEHSPIKFQAYDVMSQLTVGGFWQGITFIPGGTEHSSLRYAEISSAAIGILTNAGLAFMDHLMFKRCQCGLRIENGAQTFAHLLESSEFYHNHNGIQVYNVSGSVKLSNVTFHATRFVALSVTYPMLLHDKSTKVNDIVVDKIRITNSSYGISVSSYQPIKMEFSRMIISDVEYGVYMEYSDAVTSLTTKLSESNFLRNSLYAVYVDFKRYARYKWYGDGGNFSVSVEKCSFTHGANGLSYFGPESLNGQKSMLTIRNCEFRGLLLATILQLQEGSSFFISDNKYIGNKDRVLDITYNALDVTGTITENEIINNVPNDEAKQPPAYVKRSLIGIFGVANAQVHGTVAIEYNVISNNKFHRILDTDLMSTHVTFNVFENPSASCELCVRLPWVPKGRLLNATHNWWGQVSLVEARGRILDFFTDLDLAGADLTPVLKEARVRGASWDLATMQLKQDDDYRNGGIIVGNVSLSLTDDHHVLRSIFVPSDSSLTIPAGLHLVFAKNTGILVEGSLKIEGNDEKPVVMEASVNSSDVAWKGIRLLYSKGASFAHVAIVRSRGVQSIGFVPEMTALDVTYSTGPGLWLYVVQPTAIRLRNSYFMYNEEGIHLQIQGNNSNSFSLDVEDCHFEQNRLNGLKLEAGNIAINATFTKNTFNNNGAFGMTLNVSDGIVNVIENIFNESNSNKNQSTFLSVNFDDNCHENRNISITQNEFISTNDPLRGVAVHSRCVKHPSMWSAVRNRFINSYDGDQGAAASLTFDTNSAPDSWPLSYTITQNSFECVRLQGVAIRLTASHEEDVIVYGNSFFGCANPAQITSRFNSHRLAVTDNRITNCGSVVVHATPPTTVTANGTAKLTVATLDFSYNNISRGNGSATLKTTGYDAQVVMNFFENPAATYDLWVGDLAPVNATLNWWGTDDYNRIVARVFDGRVDFTRAQAALFPCLLSRNYSDVSTAFPDVFQVLDGVIGGSVKGDVTLPEYSGEYEVQYPIRIPYGSSLTIPAGTVLNFRNQTGIYALEFMRVRLAGSNAPNIGRVEAFVAGNWVGVCADKFDTANAHVVCKELGFADSSSFSSVGAGNLKIGISNVHCNGLELSLLDCEATVDSSINCSNQQIATVVCNAENTNRLRRSALDGSDNLPTIVSFVRIESADVGIQIDDVDGIQLHNIEVVKSRGPGVILNPKSPQGALVVASLITDGQDIGMDVQGTGPIYIRSTNSSKNKNSGFDVTSLAPLDLVELTECGVADNGGRGVRVTSDGVVNITRCEVQRNGDLGLAVKSRRMDISKSLVEDHVKWGAILNATHGDVSISTSAFVNNGGTDVTVELASMGNSSGVAGLVFTKSALVNSTYNSRKGANSDRFYAMHVKLNSRGEDGRIPIAFSDCRVLDAYSDGVWIVSGRSQMSVQVTNCKFERINGTAVHIETVQFSPELNIEHNEFNFVKKETVEVQVRS